MKPEVCVGAIIANDAGEFLLVQRGHAPSRGKWSLPGGRVEAGESLHEALRREVREETGLLVTPRDLALVLEHRGTGVHYVILDYYATADGGELTASSDAADVRWVSLDQADALPLTPGLLAILRNISQREGSFLGQFTT